VTAVRETPRRLHRFERPAIAGVLIREIINFSSYWRSATFSSTVDPTIYLRAFGFGFGSLVSRVGGYNYVQYVGTGTVATAVLFSSAMPSMFGTFVKYRFQRTYDAILAAPVDTEELVTAETLWIALRAGVYGCVPMLVAMLFGLEPRATMVFVLLIAFVSGFGVSGSSDQEHARGNRLAVDEERPGVTLAERDPEGAELRPRLAAAPVALAPVDELGVDAEGDVVEEEAFADTADVDPPLDGLLHVRLLPLETGRQVIVAQVRRRHHPPHIHPASGQIFIITAAGVPWPLTSAMRIPHLPSGRGKKS